MKPAIIEARQEAAHLLRRQGREWAANAVLMGMADDKTEVVIALNDIIRDRAEYEKDKQS